MSIFLLIQLKPLLINDYILINRHNLFYFRVAIDFATRQAYALFCRNSSAQKYLPDGGRETIERICAKNCSPHCSGSWKKRHVAIAQKAEDSMTAPLLTDYLTPQS
jgi:hypothetical protein